MAQPRREPHRSILGYVRSGSAGAASQTPGSSAVGASKRYGHSKNEMASRWSPAISRVLYPRPLPRAGDGHSSRPLVAGRLVRPTWNLVSTRATSAGKPRGSDSVLLQVGFAMPLPSPGERCALTTPFHPCRTTRLPARSGGLLSVALSFESSRLAVNQHPAHGARTFLDGDERRRDHPPNSSGKPT